MKSHIRPEDVVETQYAPMKEPPVRKQKSFMTGQTEDEIVNNIKENTNWMKHSKIFLPPNHAMRQDVETAFKILTDNTEKDKLAAGGADKPPAEVGLCPTPSDGGRLKYQFDFEDLTVGPAIPWAIKSNLVVWGSFFLFGAFGGLLIELDENHMALPPQGIRLVAGIVLLILYSFCSIYFEVNAAFYVLPTQGAAVDREEVGHDDDSKNKQNLLKGPLKFDVWMVVMVLISFCLHCDIYFTGIFVARVRKSSLNLACAAAPLEFRWTQIIESSETLKGSVFDGIQFVTLVEFGWFMMLLQFVYSILYSLPVSPNLNTTVLSDKWPTYKMVKKRDDVMVYHTPWKDHQRHGRALQALADSGRMNTCNWQDDYYLAEAEIEWKLQTVVNEMRRTNLRFFLNAFQAVYIANLQVTYLGMQKTTLNNMCHQGEAPKADWLTTTSITVTVLSGLHYIWYELNAVRQHYQFVDRALRKAKEEATTTRNNSDHWEALVNEKKAFMSKIMNRIFAVFFGLAFLQLICKAVMAMTQCESGSWNVQFPPEKGCVPFKRITFDCSTGLAMNSSAIAAALKKCNNQLFT